MAARITSQYFSGRRPTSGSAVDPRGLMGYEGHIPIPVGPEKERVVHAALKQLIDTKTTIEREGIPVEVVSCGGTSDYSIAGTFPGVTEVQAGSYLVMDTWYESHAPEFRPTLTVLATVISKTPGERIVVDAGAKVCTPWRNPTPHVINPGPR